MLGTVSGTVSGVTGSVTQKAGSAKRKVGRAGGLTTDHPDGTDAKVGVDGVNY